MNSCAIGLMKASPVSKLTIRLRLASRCSSLSLGLVLENRPVSKLDAAGGTHQCSGGLTVGPPAPQLSAMPRAGLASACLRVLTLYETGHMSPWAVGRLRTLVAPWRQIARLDQCFFALATLFLVRH